MFDTRLLITETLQMIDWKCLTQDYYWVSGSQLSNQNVENVKKKYKNYKNYIRNLSNENV